MPRYFDSTSAKPWKTAKSIYADGGRVEYASGGRVEAKDGKWIQKAKIKKGALREQLGTKKGKKISLSKLKSAAKKGGKLGKRANLALTFRKMKKA